VGRELALSILSFSSVEDTARGYALMWRDWANDTGLVPLVIVLRPGAPALPASDRLADGTGVPREVNGAEYLTAGTFRVVDRRLFDAPTPPLDPEFRKQWDELYRLGGPMEPWVEVTVEHTGRPAPITSGLA
jgi:hypothetical protein